MPRADVERFRQGHRSAASAPASSVLQGKRERVEELQAELGKRKLERELSKLDAEDVKAERERNETFRTQRLTVKAKLADVRLQRERNLQQQEREEKQGRHEEWRHGWINGARKQLPEWLSAEQEQSAIAAVESELSNWSMACSEGEIGEALGRVIDRAVAPWLAERAARDRRDTLIDHAGFELPSGATQADKARAAVCARTVLSNLPLDATDAEVRVALDDALAPMKRAIEEAQTRAHREREEADKRAWRERLIEAAARSLPYSSTEADKAQATAAVRTALSNLPLGASLTEEQTVMAGAVAPIKQAIEERAAAQQQQAQRERKKSELITFAALHASNYLDELNNDGDIELEDGEDLDDLRRDVETAVRNALAEELTGDESQDKTNRIARQIVEEELA